MTAVERADHDFAARYWAETYPDQPTDRHCVTFCTGGHGQIPAYVFAPLQQRWIRLTQDQYRAFEREAHHAWAGRDPATPYAVLLDETAARWWPEGEA